MNIRNVFDRRKHTKTDLLTIGPALHQETVIIAFSVTDAITHEVVTEKRHNDEIHLGRFDAVVVNGFTDLPSVAGKLGIRPVQQALKLLCFVIDPRHNGRYTRKITPHTLKEWPSVDLAKTLDRYEAVQDVYLR